MTTPLPPVNVLMIGTGEYTTGYAPSSTGVSDKSAGIVALCLLDLHRQHVVQRMGLCGVNGTKFPAIRKHLQEKIGNVYKNMAIEKLETFPADDTVNPKAYVDALQSFQKGDVAIIFTPDDTHYEIAKACMERGLHVLVTKPLVQTLAHHQDLCQISQANNVLCAMEVHKRWDPFYKDAHDRIRSNEVGKDFNYMYAYMSQPKHQLSTFSGWLRQDPAPTDISYYLNAHHMDWTEWTLHGRARPIRVVGTASTGVANELLDCQTIEDSITLTVTWQNLPSQHLGCAIYTSSWVAPPSDVHSQQRFSYMGSRGEITVDQAHRGCTMATDDAAKLSSINPLFVKYTPSRGEFVGQDAYGYKSLHCFVTACQQVQAQVRTVRDFDDDDLATVHSTLQGTAMLEAGRRSLNQDGRPMDIVYEDDASIIPVAIQPHVFASE